MIKQWLRRDARGFTLIELLIVIAIIALLAVAVLAAINPIEQINKSRDAGKISDSSQLIGAFDRYYARAGLFPWNLATYNGASDTDGNTLPFPDNDVCAGDYAAAICTLKGLASTDWIGELVDTGEVKSAFISRVTATNNNPNPLGVWKDANSDTVYVCFKPQSKDTQDKAIEKCIQNSTSMPSVACPDTDGNGYLAGEPYADELYCNP